MIQSVSQSKILYNAADPFIFPHDKGYKSISVNITKDTRYKTLTQGEKKKDLSPLTRFLKSSLRGVLCLFAELVFQV